MVGRTVHRALDSETAGQFPHLGNIVRPRSQNRIAETQVDGDLHALGNDVDADDLVGAEFAAERARRKSHRPQASNQHGVIATYPDLFETLIDGSESAGNLGAIGKGKLIGKSDQILLLRHHVSGHSAVALPSISTAVLLAGAGDHVAAPAIVANSAAGNVVHNHAIAGLEAAAARAFSDDLAAGFMAGDDALVAFRAFAEVLVIDAADVGTADRRGLHAQQHLSMARSRHGHGTQLDGAVSGQERSGHRLFHLTHLH